MASLNWAAMWLMLWQEEHFWGCVTSTAMVPVSFHLLPLGQNPYQGQPLERLQALGGVLDAHLHCLVLLQAPGAKRGHSADRKPSPVCVVTHLAMPALQQLRLPAPWHSRLQAAGCMQPTVC